MWGWHMVPNCFKSGKIKCLQKKKGSDYSEGNYRPITVQPALMRLYTSILNNKLVKWGEQIGIPSELQGGCRKKRGITEQVITLQALTEMRKTYQYLVFVDVRKAFDTMWRQGLFWKLKEQGIPDALLLSIMACYEDSHSRVYSGSVASNAYSTTWGQHQGDPMSPTLFGFFLNDLIQEI